MPRKGPAPKRPVVADPVYGAPIVSQLVNKILLDGKKGLDNIRPTLEVKSRRVGGSTYQVPVEVKPHRANTLALRWLTSYAKARREKTMTERLTNEILDASNGLGAAVKRREDTHKMAESNRAFAHYRW
jgi:small subunit ribosomal protein S7